MTAWFYIFILSLLGIIILMGTRVLEEKRGLPRFLSSLRRTLNRWLVGISRLTRFKFREYAERGGQSVVKKARDLREHPTLRRGVKLIITVIARVIHDIIVMILRFLGKMRKHIISLHDRHID